MTHGSSLYLSLTLSFLDSLSFLLLKLISIFLLFLILYSSPLPLLIDLFPHGFSYRYVSTEQVVSAIEV